MERDVSLDSDLGQTSLSLDSDPELGGVGVMDIQCDSPTLDTVSGFSSCSTPVPLEPFQPLFSVRFTDDVIKDGDSVKYTIRAIRLSGERKEYVVQRQYEDFEWLEHCLVTAVPIAGLIVPPLPIKPAITSEMAEARSKKHLGTNTRTLMGDDFYKDCRQFEEYIRLLMNHEVFGRDPTLELFLTEKEAPVRSKVKKGLWSRLSDSIENRKSSHKDCEEFFQHERDWIQSYGNWIKESSDNFNSMIYASQRLCGILGHLATAFTLTVGNNEGVNQISHQVCCILSEALENYKHGLEMETFHSDRTLGAYLDLYTRYIGAEKEMLMRRTCLLVDYENSNKTLDKAKLNKREAAEQAKLAAEKAFEDCSDTARREIKRFHRQRLQAFGQGLEKFAESQLRNARDLHATLLKSAAALQQLPIMPECSQE